MLLGLLSILICHENGAFWKRSSNRENLRTPASRCRKDGKHFENEAFFKHKSKMSGDWWVYFSGVYISLANRVRGPYRKLCTEFFPLRFMAQARSARTINRRGKSVTYSTERQNEVSKIFIISLFCVWRVRERVPLTRKGFKISEAGRKQNVSIWNRF